MRRNLAACLVMLPVFVWGAACSSKSDDGNGFTYGPGSSGNGNGANGSGATNGVIFGNSGSGPVSSDTNSCASDRVATEAAPIDIYVMFDQSCSMSCPAEEAGPGLCCIGGPNPRIDQVRKAMNDFLENPKSAGIGVGIGYFGYFQIGQAS